MIRIVRLERNINAEHAADALELDKAERLKALHKLHEKAHRSWGSARGIIKQSTHVHLLFYLGPDYRVHTAACAVLQAALQSHTWAQRAHC